MRAVGFARGNNGGNGRGWGNNSKRNTQRTGQSRLVLYDRPNFRGDSRDIVNSATNLGSIGDRARSVQVYGGTWELCDGAFRNARCVTVSEDVPDLRNLGLRNGVTSAREVGRSETAGGNKTLVDWEIGRLVDSNTQSNLPIYPSSNLPMLVDR